jgi:hypothetical protein
MKPLLRNVLIASGILIAGGLYFGYRKIKKIQGIFEKMTIEPFGVSNVNISLSRIVFNLDVKLTNPTNDDLFVTGSAVADLKRVTIYYKGSYMATANVELNEVSIPKNDVLVVHNIPVVADTKNILVNAVSLLNFKVADITVKGIVSVLGNEYVIGE